MSDVARKVFQYANGIQCYQDGIFDAALKRYKKNNIFLHEPKEEKIFIDIIESIKNNLYINVGAAWGYYCLLARRLNPNVEVYAFEPSKIYCNYIKENMQLNDLSNIKIFNKGLCNQNTDRRMTLNKLFEQIEGRVGLISLDIQGKADTALRHGDKYLDRVDNILIGTHGKEHQRCMMLLRNHGFQIKCNQPKVPQQPDGIIWGQAKDI